MIDTIKLFSEKLKIHVTCSIMLPSNYHTSDTIYKPYYYICLRNPFINDSNFISLVNKINSPIIAIYPTLDLKKNLLLFDIFNKNYDYSYLYLNFIFNEVIKKLEYLYRFSKSASDKTICGEKECAKFALLAPHIINNEVSNTIALDLNLENFNTLKTNLLSLFDPNINITYGSLNREKLIIINNYLKDFGIKQSNIVSSFTVLDYLNRL